ncbi:hypothetical protein NQ318_022529 [Aromia moschata]|uniref:DDE-1 domain-containing protein n=1 Tax=Aromia moschata TaxID=1265417 RepID=A0AAV8XKX0_9CUCU|nr:hypothetical protein NQ318_022529 [Aromia moschata]
MLKGAPIGTKGMANPSGWMTEEIFVESLKHFVNHVQPTVDKKALIIMDNHATHVNLQVVDFARKNHIIILTLPPHCSHRMQPLDVAVYGPFKSRYKQAMNNWLTGNPGKPVTIYEVAEFVNPAFSESFTISNICKSFEKTGIYPFNSNIFTDDDFLPSMDLTQSDNILDQPSTSSDLNSPSTSGIVNKNITKEGREELGIVSPEMHPHEKKNKTCGRKKGKCSVITDTPEKDELMKAEVDRKRGKKRDVKNKKNSKTAKKQCTSDSDSDTQISLHDESPPPPPRDLEEYLTQLEQEHGSENEEDKENCKKDDNSTCTICDGKYRLSKEEFIQCRICNKWAHESCGCRWHTVCAIGYFREKPMSHGVCHCMHYYALLSIESAFDGDC